MVKSTSIVVNGARRTGEKSTALTESNTPELLRREADYVLAYEDNDGDKMLVRRILTISSSGLTICTTLPHGLLLKVGRCFLKTKNPKVNRLWYLWGHSAPNKCPIHTFKERVLLDLCGTPPIGYALLWVFHQKPPYQVPSR
ncbi:hypothetical protein EJ110_NYTH31954 [Nymphaea thermarum]|nr:hypothetical protein EJ110_NYTH31954 [Nymphaea thermarum]